MLQTKTIGAMLAVAAASLFVSGCATQQTAGGTATAANVHCMGVNACAGKGACKSADNACKGLNACKGKGFVEMTKEDCEAKGGTMM